MVIVSLLGIGLWDPFQMAFSWLVHGGYQALINWDEPPSSDSQIMPVRYLLNKTKMCLDTWGYPPEVSQLAPEKLPKPNRKGLSFQLPTAIF